VGFALKALGVGVTISLVLVAPNAAGHLIQFVQELSDVPERERKRAASYLRSRGYVRAAGPLLHLTSKGKRRFQKLLVEELKIEKPKKWDKKWRIIFFDIPARPKEMDNARDAVRFALKRLGFVQLQKSVWVHPYPCEGAIERIGDVFGVRKFVGVALAESISNEQAIRGRFGLG
jgi:DNA-binding transcriptional regulator PaaX